MPPRTDLREIVFSSGKIRCILAHDHVLLRQGLRRLLEDEADIGVVGEAANAAECLRKIGELMPDVVVTDAATFGLPASEVEHLVTRESPETKIVFLNTQEPASSQVGLESATAGCAVRHTSAHELVEIVRNSCRPAAMNHNTAELAPLLPERRERQLRVETPFPRERVLTAREQEVLKLLAEGKTVRAAAMVLGLSSKTVDAHKFNLMRKLGIHNKAELVMWAIQKRVVKLPANF